MNLVSNAIFNGGTCVENCGVKGLLLIIGSVVIVLLLSCLMALLFNEGGDVK